jgi:NADPH-dependent 2,4-dienoyl-CoA reductase/sulfur reductase-like enzyme
MSSNISRRDFLKNAAVGSASIGVLGLAGCAPRTVSEDPTAAPAAEVKSTEGLPDVLTAAEFEESTVELAPITTFAGEVTADIVVVGAGASGVIAAITAAEEGSSVAVLQKQDKVVSQVTAVLVWSWTKVILRFAALCPSDQ